MREMKDSGVHYLGKIPTAWITTPTKQIFRIESGATPATDKSENFDGNIAWITPADYKTEDVFVSHGRRNISIIGLNSCSTVIVPTGSIVFSKRAPIGSVAITANDLCTNQGCLSCISKKNDDVKYFFYCMSVFSEQYQLLGTGTTFKEISLTNFSNFILPLPDIEEQSRIAAYLDRRCATIDALIANQQQQIEKLKQYKQSVITEAVTKGLDPNAPMKDSGVEWIGDIPKYWKIEKTCRAFSTIGSGTTPKGDEYYSDNGICWLQSGDINGGIINSPNKHITDDAMSDFSALTVYKAPYLILAMYGASVGNLSISLIDAAVNQACCVLSDSRFNSKFMFYAITAAKNYLIWLSVGGGQPNISQAIVRRLWLPTPPCHEQSRIADFLDTKCAQIDALIALKQQKADKLAQYKKSLIYEVVTGKREIEESSISNT